jgi:superfamily II DNA or RNA helicase
MSNPVLVGDAIEHYGRLAPRLLVYCVSIAHSELVADAFRAAGYRARHVDGETPTDLRRQAVAALAAGQLHLLTNCGLFSEGVDVPALGAVVLLRPTQSLGLYLQIVGCALRPAPGKERVVILDHAGNVHRHGLPDEERHWSLTSNKRKNSTGAAVKTCSQWSAIIGAVARLCPDCGHVFVAPRREVCHVPGQLIAVTRPTPDLRAISYHRALVWAGRDRHRLELVARARGYRPGWVYYQLRGAAQ